MSLINKAESVQVSHQQELRRQQKLQQQLRLTRNPFSPCLFGNTRKSARSQAIVTSHTSNMNITHGSNSNL